MTVPAQTGFVQVVRGVVSTIAAGLGFSYDEIEDLRLAVDEACAHLLDLNPPGSRITVRVVELEDGLNVEASSDATTDRWPPEGARRSLAFQVLSALSEGVTFDRSDDGPIVRFQKRRTPVA